jgi:hypothetical protein
MEFVFFLFCCQMVASLLISGVLSGDRTGLSFTVAARPRQCSYSQVPVAWDLRPYFTVSDLRFPDPGVPCLHIPYILESNPHPVFAAL